MSSSFQFPNSVEFQGHTWRKVYDPMDSSTIMPSLETPKVQGISGKWTTVQSSGGQPVRLYVVRIDLLYPAVAGPNVVKPAQLVRGMRLYDIEVKPDYTRPEEMVMYVREVSEDGEDVSQGFLNAIIGVSQSENQSKADPDWAGKLLAPLTEPAKPVEASSTPLTKAALSKEADNG